MAIPLAERFWAKVQKTETCWLWIGALTSKGYGSLTEHRGKTVLASRVSWELRFGPIQEGQWVLHRCDNPVCVRPEHLFLGDNAANMADMWSKGRGVLPKRQPTGLERARGSRQGSAKLTEETVKAIRQRYAEGDIGQIALAKLFGVGQTTVSRIIRRVDWRHVP